MAHGLDPVLDVRTPSIGELNRQAGVE